MLRIVQESEIAKLQLKEQVATSLAVDISKRSVGRILYERKFSRLVPRLRHPNSDEARQEAFKKFAKAVRQAIPKEACAMPVEVWFQDEARIAKRGR